MATIFGHSAIAAASAKLGKKSTNKSQSRVIFFLSLLLSVVPDFDVIGFRFGVRYADEWGHRGASHSILFAFGVSLIFYFITKLYFLKKATTTSKWVWAIYFFSILSHSLLDMLTNGGLGCALFWPWENSRLFFPIRPIPVSPIGIAPSLVYVIAWEFFLLFPLTALVYTLRSKLEGGFKLTFGFFYSIVLIVAYWVRLKN
jgi:inner membrane protein